MMHIKTILASWLLFIGALSVKGADFKPAEFSYTNNGYKLKFTSIAENKAAVTECEPVADWDEEKSEILVVPEKVSHLGTVYTITEIGNNAFAGLKMSGISLPDNVAIGKMAFQDCSGLKSFTLPANSTVQDDSFVKCKNLRLIALPANAKSFDCKVLERVPDLQVLVIPSEMDSLMNLSSLATLEKFSLTEPASSVFVVGQDGKCLYRKEKDNGLTLVKVADAVTGELSLMDSTAAVDADAFKGCTGITKLTLPPTVTYFRPDAFSDMTKIQSIIAMGGVIPNSFLLSKGKEEPKILVIVNGAEFEYSVAVPKSLKKLVATKAGTYKLGDKDEIIELDKLPGNVVELVESKSAGQGNGSKVKSQSKAEKTSKSDNQAE